MRRHHAPASVYHPVATGSGDCCARVGVNAHGDDDDDRPGHDDDDIDDHPGHDDDDRPDHDDDNDDVDNDDVDDVSGCGDLDRIPLGFYDGTNRTDRRSSRPSANCESIPHQAHLRRFP